MSLYVAIIEELGIRMVRHADGRVESNVDTTTRTFMPEPDAPVWPVEIEEHENDEVYALCQIDDMWGMHVVDPTEERGLIKYKNPTHIMPGMVSCEAHV